MAESSKTGFSNAFRAYSYGSNITTVSVCT